MKKNIVIILSFIVIVLLLAVGYLTYESSQLSLEVERLKDQNEKNVLENTTLQTSYDNLIGSNKDLEHYLMKRREGTYPIEKLESLDLNGIDKIMITTHPDDEMFWGGGHLLNDNYLVVCVTCGMDDHRQREFENTMNDVGDKYVMLGYPRPVDESLKREFNWKAAGYLTQDLENILNLKSWKEIVTHNPEGEYGHKYHILTSQIVTSIVKDKNRLSYFGKFYKKEEVDKLSSDVLDENTYNRKLAIIMATYKSQWLSAENNSHMFKNENFIKYSDWK